MEKKEATKKTAAEAEKAPTKKAATKKPSIEERYAECLKGANPLLGDKDPVVIDWCRDNMSPEDFEAKYKGRKIS